MAIYPLLIEYEYSFYVFVKIRTKSYSYLTKSLNLFH